MVGKQLEQRRSDLMAYLDCQRAAPAEPAARGRVDDPGRLTAVGVRGNAELGARVWHR